MSDFYGPMGPGGQVLQTPDLDWNNVQMFAFTTATASQAINARCVRIVCTANAWIKASLAGTAANIGAGSIYFPANVVAYLAIPTGWKISVLQDTTGGNCSLAPCISS